MSKVVFSVALTMQEEQSLTEIAKIENVPRHSKSAAVGYLIRFYSGKKLREFEILPPDAAIKEAARLEKAANWYRLQAAADEAEAKRTAEAVLKQGQPTP